MATTCYAQTTLSGAPLAPSQTRRPSANTVHLYRNHFRGRGQGRGNIRQIGEEFNTELMVEQELLETPAWEESLETFQPNDTNIEYINKMQEDDLNTYYMNYKIVTT